MSEVWGPDEARGSSVLQRCVRSEEEVKKTRERARAEGGLQPQRRASPGLVLVGGRLLPSLQAGWPWLQVLGRKRNVFQ